MNRLDRLFNTGQKGLLSVFFTAGYPSLNDTIDIARRLEAAGADLIEIGIPFSDPVADGPVIQESSLVAIRNGMSLELLLAQVREIRASVKLPILLMGYLNPVMQFGFQKFCLEAASAGVDGLILPDLPLDEYESQYREHVEAANLVAVFLVAPTTSPDRVRRIDALSSAFIYAVAASSITGARQTFSPEQVAYFERLKEMRLSHPFLTGFGIGSAELFRQACDYAAGAIVGSAFIQQLKEHGRPGNFIEGFVRQLKNSPVEASTSPLQTQGRPLTITS